MSKVYNLELTADDVRELTGVLKYAVDKIIETEKHDMSKESKQACVTINRIVKGLTLVVKNKNLASKTVETSNDK